MLTNRTILITFTALFLTGCRSRKTITEQSSHLWADFTQETVKEMSTQQTIQGRLKEFRLTLSPPDSLGKQTIESITQKEVVFLRKDSTREMGNERTYTEIRAEEKKKKAEKRLPPISLLFVIATLLVVVCFIYFLKR